LFTFICEKLKATWSPEQIALVWKAKHPGERLSVGTIYRDVKKGRLPGIAAKTHLRRRGKRKYGKRSKFNGVQPTHTIHERPQAAENREEVGHWEGDTMEGKNHQGRFATFIDRCLRVGVAVKVDSKSADDMVRATIRALGATGLPVRTITLDNGVEMAKYKEIEKALKTTVYFADPRSPWQRGTNENFNGQLRFFFPRDMNLRGVSEDELTSAISLINDRPRKCLGLRSPSSLAQELLHLH
jgi:IS30 family transposase